MGLDMYFTKRTYVQSWDHTKPEERYQITITRGGKPVPKTEIDPDKITYIMQDTGYWRKANAIHKWFVENVQEGDDDCKDYYVSRDKITELLDAVHKVLAASKLAEGTIQNGYTYKNGKEVPIIQDGRYIKDPTVAKKLLPTQEGFFFGSTGYDQWYFEDWALTKHILEEALLDTASSFYYASSW